MKKVALLCRTNRKKGFTLIELLIVIAIILILIAIALPNFLEAQLRAKVTAAKAEMRSLGEATGSYFVDWGSDPAPDNFHQDATRDRVWWGFASHALTTPNAYITSIPTDVFPDVDSGLVWGWTGLDPNNNPESHPYQVVVRVKVKNDEGPILAGEEFWHFDHPNGCNPCFGANSNMDDLNCQNLRRAPWVYFTGGPDLDSTLTWLGCNNEVYATYSATNGTQSSGDLYMPGY